MTDAEWQIAISQQMRLDRGQTWHARAFDGKFGSRQAPHRFYCDDGQRGELRRWVVKGHGFPREAAVEITVHSLGQALGAPVPQFAKVVVSPSLVKRSTALRASNYPPGTWFGSEYIEGFKDILADQKKTS